MRRLIALAACALLVATGCGKGAKERTLALSLHGLTGCKQSFDPRTAEVSFQPLGDYAEPSAPRFAALAELSELDFPEHTLAVGALARADAGEFWGYTERPRGDDAVSLLLWPKFGACRLDGELGASPSSGEGQALGYSPAAQRVLIVGGTSRDSPAGSVAAVTFDLGSGRLEAVATPGARSAEDTALAEPRAFASVSEFGEQLLVAGGENPLSADSSGQAVPSATAEIFNPRTRRFSANKIELSVARSHHAASVLASGETLLVGGRGPSGSALNVLETVSPINAHASIRELAALAVPRLSPQVFVLDDGRIFVGGGNSVDGAPVAELEWLSADARELLAVSALPARSGRAFAALPGGGVLAVGGCAPSGAECAAGCRAGCPPDSDGDGVPDYDAWWLLPDGTQRALEFEFAAPAPLLMGGADGMPLLTTGAAGDSRIYRFEPWRARFAPLVEVDAAPHPDLPALAVGAGALVWLSAAAPAPKVYGLRAGIRGPYAIDDNLISGAAPSEAPPPFPLVPDRPLDGHVHFDPNAQILLFDSDASARLYVASSHYGNFAADLTVEGDAPHLILGAHELGGPECPWPSDAAAQFRVERAAGAVTLSSNGRTSPPCAGPAGRVRLGLMRGTGAFGVRHMTVVRRPD